MKVQDNLILAIPHNDKITFSSSEQYQSLKGEKKRNWFSNHAYLCLPLVIGNQYGFVVKSLHNFDVLWNGGESPSDLKIFKDQESFSEPKGQYISSHFGSGIFTVQNSFSLRTPDGINLMTINPPNYFIDGIHYMTGVVEADNLRRDFTFNLRVTRPNYRISIKRGDWIGCFIPIQRYFVDNFSMVDSKDHLTEQQIKEEQDCMEAFGKEREGIDTTKPHGAGRRYFNGEDAYGNEFLDHQKHI